MKITLFDKFLNNLLHCNHYIFNALLWVIKGIWSGHWVWGMSLFLLLQISSDQEYIKKLLRWQQNFTLQSGLLAAWIVGGIITLFGALSNAEVAGLLADTGGEFVYLKKIYNRFFAFMYGWSLFTVIQTATISSLAYVFAQSLNSIIPIPEIFTSLQHFTIGGVFYPFQDFGVKLTAILLILLLTGLNISGLKSGAGVSKAIMFLVFTGLLTIVIFGLSSTTTRPANFMDLKELTSGTVTLSSFYTAMLAAFWAYQGWVSVGFIGGEVKDPTKNIPKGIVTGVFIVIFIYLLVNVTYLSLLIHSSTCANS